MSLLVLFRFDFWVRSVWFRFGLVDFVSFRFLGYLRRFCFGSIYGFVLFEFVSFRSVLFRFVLIGFSFAFYRYPLILFFKKRMVTIFAEISQILFSRFE